MEVLRERRPHQTRFRIEINDLLKNFRYMLYSDSPPFGAILQRNLNAELVIKLEVKHNISAHYLNFEKKYYDSAYI